MFKHCDEVDQTPGTFSALEGFEVLGVGANSSGRSLRDGRLRGRIREKVEGNRCSIRGEYCRNVSPSYLRARRLATLSSSTRNIRAQRLPFLGFPLLVRNPDQHSIAPGTFGFVLRLFLVLGCDLHSSYGRGGSSQATT